MEPKFGVKKLERAVLLIVLIMMSWATFSHGLYLYSEFLIANILVGAIGIMYLKFSRTHKKLNLEYLDCAVIIFGLAYTLSIWGSANVADSIAYALRTWTYVIFYIVLSRTLSGVGSITIFLKGTLLLGSLVSLFGLLTVNGVLFNYGQSWTDTLSSTFQYHNALATFIIPLILFSGFFFSLTANKLEKLAYLEATYIMSLALAGSQSRGGYLVFGLAIIAAFFAFGRKNKRDFFIIIVTILLGFSLWDRYSYACSSKSLVGAISWLGSGLFLTVVLGLISTFSFKKANININRKLIIGLSTLVFGLVIFAAIQLIDFNGEVISRIKQINFSEHSVSERFVFYMDALRMVKDNMLLGLGGGGWAAAYQSYQSYRYYSTEVHSAFLNILVETGIIGLLVFLSVIILLIFTVIRNYRKIEEKETCDINLLIGIGILCMLIHALVDFNLSKGSVALLFWSLAASIRAIEAKAVIEKMNVVDESEKQDIKVKGKSKEPNYKIYNISLIIICIVLVIEPMLIFLGSNFALKGKAAADKGDYINAIKYYSYSTKLSPFDSKYWSDLASIKSALARNSNDKFAAEESRKDIERALKYSEYDPNIKTGAISVMSILGDYESAYRYAKEGIALSPFRIEVYETAAQAGLNYTRFLAANKDLEMARQIGENVISIPDEVISKVENLDPAFKKNWIVDELTVSPDVLLHVAEVKVIMGDESGVRELEELANNPKVSVEAATWLLAVAMVNQDSSRVSAIGEQLSQQDRINAQMLVMDIGALK